MASSVVPIGRRIAGSLTFMRRSTSRSTVGWAIRALTPVFDGLWARAPRSPIGKAYRAPCPRGHALPVSIRTAWARRTIDLAVPRIQCHRLCPPYESSPSLRRALRGVGPQRQVELLLHLTPLVANEALPQPLELQVDDRRRVQCQQLAEQQAADHGDPQGIAQLGAGAATNRKR